MTLSLKVSTKDFLDEERRLKKRAAAAAAAAEQNQQQQARSRKNGDQTCHQVHFQHGIFNNFCSTIGQFNKNLFNNRQFHQQHYSTIGLFNNFKFNIRQLNNSVMVNSTTKNFYRSSRVGVG